MDRLARIKELRNSGLGLLEAQSIFNRESLDALIQTATSVDDIKICLRKLVERVSF